MTPPGTAHGTAPAGGRTTLRWRLTIVYGAVAIAVGVVLLLLSMVLVDRALSEAQVSNPRLVVPLSDGSFITLGEYQDQLRQDTLRQLFRQGLLLLALIGLAGVGVAYYLAGRVLTPLQRITTTARRLSAEQLDARIALGGPADELKELADTFDAMLERLEKSFEAQRRFVADASHELRTPLAVMRTEVDVALADPAATKQDLRAAALVVRDATERADRLLESLLLLARSDRLSVDGLPVTERVDLPAVCEAAVAAMAAEVAAKGLQVATSFAPAAVHGDVGLLERLAGNLVENAVRHNVPGGWVRVDTGSVDGRSRLQVTNTGPEVPGAEVEALFEPFRRHGTARTARRGAGLGLAIVRAGATVHGGSARAEPRPGGGLVVTVDLPDGAAQD